MQSGRTVKTFTSSRKSSDGDRSTRVISAEPVSVGATLPFSTFAAYAKATHLVSRPHATWEDIRCKLGLDSSEVLVLAEERVAQVSRDQHKL